jgi:hypothetical protein
MRRIVLAIAHLIPRLTVALLTFVLGVTLTQVWFHFTPRSVTLCELARHPDWYNHTMVRVKAPAFGVYEGILLADVPCQSLEAWAEVELAKDVPQTSASFEAFESFVKHDFSREHKKADAEVIGRFDQHASMGCFGPRFGIAASSVEFTSPVTVELMPEREKGARQ